MREVVIVSGVRTPIGDFLGSLKDFTAVQLGTIALKAAIERAGITPDQIGRGSHRSCLSGRLQKAIPAARVTIHAGCPVENGISHH